MGGWMTAQGTPNWGTAGRFSSLADDPRVILRKPLITGYNSSNFHGEIFIKDFSIEYIRNGGDMLFGIYSITAGGSIVTEYEDDQTGIFSAGSDTVTYDSLITLDKTDISSSFMEINVLAAAAPADALSIGFMSMTILVKNEENLAIIAL